MMEDRISDRGVRTSRIAIIDPVGRHAGHHYYVDNIARAMQRQGAWVRLYTTEQTGISGSETYEVRTVFGQLYGQEPVWSRGLRYVLGMSRTALSARKFQSRFVHLHLMNFDWRDVYAVWLLRLLGMRIFFTVHDVESFGDKGSRVLRRLVLQGGAGYILHNQFSANIFLRDPDTPKRPIAIIPHGHYVDSFPIVPTREEARRHLGLGGDAFLFLFFGNSRKEKGLDILLEACAGLRKDLNWFLLVAGKQKPAQLEGCISMVRQYGLEERVRIDAKHVSDEDAVAYYRASDLVVVPYRVVYESGVTIMSMTLGRAVLASDLPPLVESTDNGAAGLLFEAGNVGSLARQLDAAIKSKDRIDELGELGSEHVRARRDWDLIAKRTLEFLDRL